MRLTIFLFCFLVLSGCDSYETLSQGMELSNKVAADIEASTGNRPVVGYSWRNGMLASVSVNFEGTPYDLTFEHIEDASRSAIEENFSQTPGQIVITFSVPGEIEK